MATPGKVDYHIHYFVDGCTHEEIDPPPSILPLVKLESME